MPRIASAAFFRSRGFGERARRRKSFKRAEDTCGACVRPAHNRGREMPQKRAKKSVLSKNTPTKEQVSVDLRQSRCALFIQQFKKEAQERVNEMEARIENMLATVDKVFKVELLKMPPSLQNTRMREIINDALASDVSIAMNRETHDIHQPLRRVTSKKEKLPDDALSPQVPRAPKLSAKPTKGGKGLKRTRTFAGSNSTENLRHCTASLKKSQSHSDKIRNQTTTTKPKLRALSSSGDLSCSVAGCAPHVTITTSEGQMFCFSEETKDDIDFNLLDDVAFHQIQKLMRLMDYLTSKAKVNGEE